MLQIQALDKRTTLFLPSNFKKGYFMGSFLTLIGTAGNLLVSWLGMEKQEEAYAKESKKEEERYQTELGMVQEDRALNRQELAYKKRERAREWKWKSEDRNWERGTALVNRFTGMLDRDPVLKNNLMSMWNK